MKLKLIFALFITVAFAITTLFVVERSSTNISKSAKHKTFSFEHDHERGPASHSKRRSDLFTKIERVDDGSDLNFIRLRGEVRSTENSGDVVVNWIVPDDVQSSGQLQFKSQIVPGEPLVFELVISQRNQFDQRIILEANAEFSSGASASSVAHFFTVQQDMLKQRSKANLKKAKEWVRKGELKKIVY